MIVQPPKPTPEKTTTPATCAEAIARSFCHQIRVNAGIALALVMLDPADPVAHLLRATWMESRLAAQSSSTAMSRHSDEQRSRQYIDWTDA